MVSTANSEKEYKISVFRSIEEMSGALFDLLVDEFTLSIAENRSYHLVLSGGSTPVKIFERIARMPLGRMNWDFLHIYWGDERCVPPSHTESNYLNLWNAILRYIDIPEDNIHRIKGENDPEMESRRYAEVLQTHSPSANVFPRFDLVLLGIGEDGHTASIFPDTMHKLATNELCYVAIQPQSRQNRITMSLKVLNNSKKILFLATGDSKSGILAHIINKEQGFLMLPASYVKPESGELMWFLDAAAAKKIN